MTPFSVVYKAFLREITEDMYMEFTEQDTQKMLNELLESAIPMFEFPRKSLDTIVAEDDDEDCPSEDTECKDCPYRALETKETAIEDYHWIEFITVCGNHKMLRFPYKSTEEMKKHVLQVITNSYKFPLVAKLVNKLFF